MGHTYSKESPDIAVCGSILQHCHQIDSNTKIWGCGFHNAQDNTRVSPQNVYALRGQLSYQKLGLTRPVALGDPGLLVSRFYHPSIKPTNKIGIVCHYLDHDFLTQQYGDKYKIIDTHTSNVEAFVRDLESCEFIFSSSLHGLIFSHSLGIPAVHLETINVGSKDNFKFKDYYSVLDIDYQKVLWTEDLDLETVMTQYKHHCPSRKRVLQIQEGLMRAFPYPQLFHTKPKVCLGAIAKNENHYLREWVEHYHDLGFDKIFLFDNNDRNGERFDEVIQDYIDEGFVEVFDVRGQSNMQITSFDRLYHSQAAQKFDWITFFDIDEFLFLDDCKFIQEFVTQPQYAPFNCIAINWKYFDDNNLPQVIGGDFRVKTRFTHEYLQPKSVSFAEHKFSKRIMKTKIPGLVINSSHGPINRISSSETVYNGAKSNPGVICCNVEGKPLKVNYLCFEDWSHKGAHLKHYRFKTIEEYITNKMKRGYPTLYKNCGKDLGLQDFFKLNQVTLAKLQVAATLLGESIEELQKQFPPVPPHLEASIKQNEKSSVKQHAPSSPVPIQEEDGLPSLSDWLTGGR